MSKNLFYLSYRTILIPCLLLGVALSAPAGALEPGAGPTGRVEIPLEVYQRLLDASAPGGPGHGHALGQATAKVEVEQRDGRATARVAVELEIRVLADEWVLVPVLPIGTPIVSVTVDGKPVQLVTSLHGLAWATQRAGTYAMSIRYAVDASRSQSGFVASLPVPAAAATALSATLPGAALDAAVIPATDLTVTRQQGQTLVRATLPATRGVQLSWRRRTAAAHLVSRATYRGELVGDAIVWNAELDVELTHDEPTALPLLPTRVTLNDLRVDDEEAVISVVDGRFAARLAGRGLHRVQMTFQVEVEEQQGRPSVGLSIPEIPISRFEVKLPGRKVVTVAPQTNVTHQGVEDTTLATFHVPMREGLSFSWGEAIPEADETEVRAHAQVLHAVRAEEGVLYVEAAVEVAVSRGSLSAIDLRLPPDVQVERVTASGAELADWRIGAGSEDEQQLSVFLEGALTGLLALRVHYDRPIDSEQLEIPLLSVRGVDRQRGMLALLATRELALDPVEHESLTSVGENQLPAAFRQGIEHTVAHTFKYAQTTPRLVVALAMPERIAGKFDVDIDTLVSITDVTVQGAAGIRVQIKSGAIDRLRLTLPADVNLLSLTAPSLRTYKVATDGDERFVDVEFTQEMEGGFRMEASYERIIADSEADVVVPTLAVAAAEVERGRIAVEALAAVEVQVARSDQLSAIDPADLPKQLILKTTNPILLAYKYVRADSPTQLALRMTRHRELAVQGAAIDRADYRTLFTGDGLAVTTARFVVRNRRQQFLRVELPAGSTVWSAAVDGQPEKPAISEEGPEASDGEEAERRPEILLRVIDSAEPFPVELVYATPVARMQMFGSVRATLPRPGMVVTRTRWSVFLPDSHRYGKPDSNLMTVLAGQRLDQGGLARELSFDAARSASVVGPLQIVVPEAGVQLVFEKLYANQSEEDAWIAIPYRSLAAARLGQLAALLGAGLVWLAIALALRRIGSLGPLAASPTALLGLALLGLGLGHLGAQPGPALILGLLLAVGSGLVLLRERGRDSGGGVASELG